MEEMREETKLDKVGWGEENRNNKELCNTDNRAQISMETCCDALLMSS